MTPNLVRLAGEGTVLVLPRVNTKQRGHQVLRTILTKVAALPTAAKVLLAIAALVVIGLAVLLSTLLVLIAALAQSVLKLEIPQEPLGAPERAEAGRSRSAAARVQEGAERSWLRKVFRA